MWSDCIIEMRIEPDYIIEIWIRADGIITILQLWTQAHWRNNLSLEVGIRLVKWCASIPELYENTWTIWGELWLSIPEL